MLLTHVQATLNKLVAAIIHKESTPTRWQVHAHCQFIHCDTKHEHVCLG